MLRDYQTKTIEAIRDSYLKGTRQQVVSMSTGLGKTVALAHIPSQLRDILPGRMLVLAHREELIDQAIDKIKSANPGLSVAKEMAEDRADANADIIVASVATLGRKGSKRAERFDWNSIDKVITDECHHSIAQSYQNIYELADVLRPDTHKLHVGFTATPQRGDGKALAKIYQRIVYEYGMRRAIEDGWLVDVKGVRVTTDTSLDDISTVAGDFAQDDLADTVNTPQRNLVVVKAWLEHAGGRQTVGFTVNIKHAQDLAEMLVRHGVKAEAVWGDDPERSDKLARHRAKETTVLLNCGILTEGYDDWRIGCILLARPTKSSVLFTQMVGRGTRLQDGTGNLLSAKEGWTTIDENVYGPLKQDCVVIDVVDSSYRHSLVTLPTLMGMSAEFDLDTESLVKTIQKLEEFQKQHPEVDLNKLKSLNDLATISQTINLFEFKFPEEVESNSELSWHTAPDGGFVLLLPGKESVRITQNLLDKWEIIGIINSKKYKGERDSIEQAFQAADDLIYNNASSVVKILKREEKWHKDPATPGQLKFLRKIYKGKPLPTDITKGKASKLISQFLAGAA